MKTKVGTARNGTLTLDIPNGGIPALRLVKYHAPNVRIELTDDQGTTLLVPLGEISLAHDLLAGLNASKTAANGQ